MQLKDNHKPKCLPLPDDYILPGNHKKPLPTFRPEITKRVSMNKRGRRKAATMEPSSEMLGNLKTKCQVTLDTTLWANTVRQTERFLNVSTTRRWETTSRVWFAFEILESFAKEKPGEHGEALERIPKVVFDPQTFPRKPISQMNVAIH